MKKHVTDKLMMAQFKMKRMVREFLTSERGDTNFVSIMLIIVIVIALATIFKEKLAEIAETVFGQLTDWIG